MDLELNLNHWVEIVEIFLEKIASIVPQLSKNGIRITLAGSNSLYQKIILKICLVFSKIFWQ